MYTIELIKKEDMGIIIPLLQNLNPKIELDVLEQRVNEMLLSNYECVGVFDDKKLIGISGLWILTKYYVGKHIEPDNIYILDQYQGKGIGKQLMEWIFKYAKSKGCVASELNCYLENTSGHKFWEQNGYKKIAYHFSKKL